MSVSSVWKRRMRYKNLIDQSGFSHTIISKHHHQIFLPSRLHSHGNWKVTNHTVKSGIHMSNTYITVLHDSRSNDLSHYAMTELRLTYLIEHSCPSPCCVRPWTSYPHRTWGFLTCVAPPGLPLSRDWKQVQGERIGCPARNCSSQNVNWLPCVAHLAVVCISCLPCIWPFSLGFFLYPVDSRISSFHTLVWFDAGNTNNTLASPEPDISQRLLQVEGRGMLAIELTRGKRRGWSKTSVSRISLLSLGPRYRTWKPKTYVDLE